MKFPYNRVLEIQQAFRNNALTRLEAHRELDFLLNLEDDSVAAARTPESRAESYGPLLRLSDVCNILTRWAELFSTKLEGEQAYKTEERDQFRIHWGKVYLAIVKSNLLNRLFFSQEGIRTEVCPDHKGRWSGCFAEGQNGPCPCQTGGNVTGWLPANPEDSDRSHWDEATKSYRND